jgi:hypothetical protein
MLFAADRKTIDSASSLMMLYGNDARDEANARANVSRDRGNVIWFCHWRQVRHVIEALSAETHNETRH